MKLDDTLFAQLMQMMGGYRGAKEILHGSTQWFYALI